MDPRPIFRDRLPPGWAAQMDSHVAHVGEHPHAVRTWWWAVPDTYRREWAFGLTTIARGEKPFSQNDWANLMRLGQDRFPATMVRVRRELLLGTTSGESVEMSVIWTWPDSSLQETRGAGHAVG